MYYNRCGNSIESTVAAAKDIVNRLGIHGDCASLVVVSGGIVFPSEYEGQVSCGLPVGFAGQQPFIFGALPSAALSPQPFHSSQETDA